MKAPSLITVLSTAVSALQTLPPVNPVRSDSNTDKNGFSLETADKTIYLQADFAHHRDQNGLTLIPPSAHDFARTFQQDLQETTGASWALQVINDEQPGPSNRTGVFLGKLGSDSANFTYENGQATEEGYELDVRDDLVSVRGSGARGMWWGTRTVLQQLLLATESGDRGSGVIPSCRVQDAPAYPVRGFLLDAGRKWYSLEYLKDLCTYASFFKISEFHYHASDNYPLSRGPDVPWNEVYSQFALRPENPELMPLVRSVNETLSRTDFDEFQHHCAQRGVTVIPEIESPGHCLAVTKWKPELALEARDLLNLSHPETKPLMKSIWTEFLPWFHTKEVHIGADEYDAKLADDYITFVNEMSDFVRQTSGKTVRIWGTPEPSDTLSVNKNITVQHWQYGQSDPQALAREGYPIINSEDTWAYMSLKNTHEPITPAPYPQFFNNTRVLNFAGRDGWQWAPELFNRVNVTEQPDARAVRGAVLAAWNDNGPDATTQLEAFYAIRNGIPVVASRAWSGDRGPRLNEQLTESIEILTANAVGQNLDRRLSNLTWTNPKPHAKREIHLGHGSKGMDYTLRLNVTGPFTLSSDDASLSLSEQGQLVFVSDGHSYPLRSVAETDGFDPVKPGRIWTNTTSSTHEVVSIPQKARITMTGDPIGGSRVWVDERFAGRFETFVYGGKNQAYSWSQMAFVVPLDVVRGGIESLSLR